MEILGGKALPNLIVQYVAFKKESECNLLDFDSQNSAYDCGMCRPCDPEQLV